MTKSELRKARKAAVAAGMPLTGELAVPSQQPKPQQSSRFTRALQTRRKYATREEQHARYIDCGPSAWDDR